MKKKLLVVFIAVGMMFLLASCGYDFSKEFNHMQTLVKDQNVDYETFMQTYHKFFEELDNEIEKVSSNYKKTGKADLANRLDFLNRFNELIYGDFIDDMIFKAKKLSGSEAVNAAKEIFDSTEWDGPVCNLISNSDSILSIHYDPSLDEMDISPLYSGLERYMSSYDLSLNKIVNIDTGDVVSSISTVVSSPWGMTLDAVCDKTVSFKLFKGLAAYNDEYPVTLGEDFTFPQPLYGDEVHFIGWKKGSNVYYPGDKTVFNKNSKVDFDNLYIDLKLVDYKLYDSNDNNGFLSIGESGWLDLTLKNLGNYDAEEVYVQLVSETAGVSVSNDAQYFRSVDEDEYTNLSRGYSSKSKPSYTSSSSKYTNFFPIKIDSSVKNGTQVVLKALISDSSNGLPLEDRISFNVNKLDTNISLADYYFDDDGNGNGKLEIGETARLDVMFYNSGADVATGVTAKLECETEGVIITKSTIDASNNYEPKQYRTLSGDYSSKKSNVDWFRKSGNYFSVRMPNDMAEGTMIKFKVTLTDKLGNVSVYPIEFEAKKQELGVTLNVTYNSYDKGGYELVYPGENLELKTWLGNTSSTALSDVRVTINTESPYITPSSRSLVFTNPISSNDSLSWYYRSSSSDDRSFNVSPLTPIGTELDFGIVISDATGKTRKYSRTYKVGPEKFNPTFVGKKSVALDMAGESSLKPGSYLYLDTVIYNIGPYYEEGKNVSIKIVSDCPEITILKSECFIGSIESGNYAVASKGSWTSYDMDSAIDAMNPTNGFEMKISSDADSKKEYSITLQACEDGQVLTEETWHFHLDE